MKIVVLDGYTENPGDLSWGGLEQLGDVTVYDRTSYTESPLIAERIGDAEIVVMNKTPISRATLDKCPNIKLIAVLATGYNVVDIAYAKEKGIPVCNVPNYGGYSVSQFAIALMLEACLHIGHHNQTVHDGKWQNGNEWCYWDYPLIELAGKPTACSAAARSAITRQKRPRASECTSLPTTSIPHRPPVIWAWNSWSSTISSPALMCWASRCLSWSSTPASSGRKTSPR